MELKVNTICQIISKENKSKKKRRDAGLIIYNNGYYVEILTEYGNTTTVCVEDVLEIKSVRLKKEVRDMFNEHIKKTTLLNKKRDEWKNIEKEIFAIRKEIGEISTNIKKIQNILEDNEFFELLFSELEKNKPNVRNWIIDKSPGCCVCYQSGKHIYFYREFDIVQKYGAKHTTLAFEEYDGEVFMYDDYENLEEYKKYKKIYETKLFNDLEVTSMCYVNGGKGLTFKSYQSIPIPEGGKLTKELVEKITKIK